MAIDAIDAHARRLLASRLGPLLLALDGPSGAGKSTLTAQLAAALGGCVVPADDFFAAAIADAEWAARSPQRRAEDCLDWRWLRAEALEPLLAGRAARWRAFDFAAGPQPDGSYAMGEEIVERQPAPFIVLDGAYSTRPELLDLIHLTILVDVPRHIRHERLAAREDATFLDAWHRRWDAAEEYYFTQVRPRAAFYAVVES